MFHVQMEPITLLYKAKRNRWAEHKHAKWKKKKAKHRKPTQYHGTQRKQGNRRITKWLQNKILSQNFSEHLSSVCEDRNSLKGSRIVTERHTLGHGNWKPGILVDYHYGLFPPAHLRSVHKTFSCVQTLSSCKV